MRILELLRDGEHSVGELQSALGLDSSGTSQHLASLRRQGQLESRSEHELNAAANPYYDLQRFGLNIVASPRHADVLLAAGDRRPPAGRARALSAADRALGLSISCMTDIHGGDREGSGHDVQGG